MRQPNLPSRYRIAPRAISFTGKKKDFMTFLRVLGRYKVSQAEFCRTALIEPTALPDLR